MRGEYVVCMGAETVATGTLGRVWYAYAIVEILPINVYVTFFFRAESANTCVSIIQGQKDIQQNGSNQKL